MSLEEAKTILKNFNFTDSGDQYLLTRTVILSGEIDEITVKDITEKLLLLNYLDTENGITLIIDSYGGDVYSSLFMFDFVNSLKCNVSTIVIGKAMSAAFFIAIAGTKGKRYITKNATMMNHQISAESIGKLSDMVGEINECKRLEKVMNRIIKSHTKCGRKVMQKFLSGDVYFDSRECLKNKFVDAIIDKLP
ncbi:MAG: ATP-dependent Clp protease proteolytic subunit [bacterium]